MKEIKLKIANKRKKGQKLQHGLTDGNKNLTIHRSYYPENVYALLEFAKLTVLEIHGKNYCLTPMFYFSKGGHVFWQIYAKYPRNIHTKFGSNWSSSVRGEGFI